MKKVNLFVGIFFLSLSVLIFELTLIRLFSVILLKNLGFIGISIALFGLALGGIFVYLKPKYFSQDKFYQNLGLFSFLYAVSLIIVSLFFILLKQRDEVSAHTIIFIFTISSIPFLLANICLSLLFKIKNQLINRLYFFDLIGAGLGVILAVIVMNYLPAISVILLASITGFLAALFFNINNKYCFKTSLMLIIVLIILICINQKINFLKMKVIYSKIGEEKTVIYSKWNSFSHISLTDGQNEDPDISLSPSTDPTNLPQRLGIRIDASAFTPVYEFDGDYNKFEFLKTDLSSLALHISNPGKSLVIGSGGGRDVLTALLYNYQVMAVDINPIIINDLMKNKLKNFSGGLYFDPSVEVKIAEGRSFINQDKNKYNIINLPLVDTWASTATGHLTLVENYLYTVEAFNEYLNHLERNGILTISRWELDGKKLVSIFLESSKKIGIENPEKNIVIISTWPDHPGSLNNYLFKNTPFTINELEKIKEFTENNGFFLTYTPDQKYENDYYSLLTSQNKNKFINDYDQDIKPVYDNRPFFFFTTPFKHLFEPDSWQNDGGLISTLIIVFIFTFFSIIFPMLLSRSNLKIAKNNLGIFLPYIGYFSCLGLAFIMIEISLMQKFILYLEQPIYSYSVILASLLTYAGIGSFISKNIKSEKKLNFLKLTLCILVVIIITVLSLQTIINSTISLTVYYKIIIASLFIAPLSILMGMMLPLGFKRLNYYKLDDLVPWCWAVNGAMSVLATVIAILLAIYLGFNAVLLIGGSIYLIAFINIFLLKENKYIN